MGLKQFLKKIQKKGTPSYRDLSDECKVSHNIGTVLKNEEMLKQKKKKGRWLWFLKKKYKIDDDFVNDVYDLNNQFTNNRRK